MKKRWSMIVALIAVGLGGYWLAQSRAASGETPAGRYTAQLHIVMPNMTLLTVTDQSNSKFYVYMAEKDDMRLMQTVDLSQAGASVLKSVLAAKTPTTAPTP